MGTDLDFETHLKKNKLVSLQYQQPPHELDGVTQSTEQTSPGFIMQLLQMLSRRFGNNQDNGSHNTFAVMIQLGQNQHIIIAFPREGTLNQGRNQLRHRPFLQRQQEPEQRPRPLGLFMQRARENEQMIINNEIRQRRTQSPWLASIEPFTESEPRELQVRPRSQQLIQELQQMDRQFLEGLDNQVLTQPTISSLGNSVLDQLRNQESIRFPAQYQQPNWQNQISIEPEQPLRPFPQPHNQQGLQNARQQFTIERQMQAQINRNQSVNCLNQNSILRRNNSRTTQQPVQDDHLSCWQTFTRALGQLFRRNH